MKSVETKSTTISQSLQAKNEDSNGLFFEKDGGNSVLSNDTKDPHFFGNRQTFSNKQPFFSGRPLVQTKLTIGQPGDKYEKEADAMADQVVQRLSENNKDSALPVQKIQTLLQPKPIFESETKPKIQTKPLNAHILNTHAVQPKCAECEQEEQPQKKEESTEEEKLQMKPDFESAATPPDDNSIQRNCTGCSQEEKTIQNKADSEEEELLQTKAEAVSSPTPSLESRLQSTKGSGSPLAENTRTKMENSFGRDFSGVRVHTDSSAVQMNKELRAHAFAHGSDIYFNSGKFNPNEANGQKLLAHELTHTIQQNGGAVTPSQRKIQRWPDWVSDAAGWVGDTASDVAGSVVDGAQYVGGQVADGTRWVSGKVAAGAEWAGEQLSAAAQWIVDRIRGVINSGTNYLNERWESIQNFGRTCFDDIKNGFGTLVHFVTTPLSGIMSALSVMNADMLGSVWNLLKTGSNALWSGINSVINSVLQIGQGIWNSVSGFINGIFNTIAGLFNNSAFSLLPDFIKEEAISILNDLRSLWNQVSAFWTDLWERLTSTIQEVLAAVRSFVDKVIGFAISKVISMVRDLKGVYDYVKKFFADPRATIQPFIDAIAEKLNNQVPPGANNLGTQLAQENYAGHTQAADNGSIQRVPESSEDRRPATLAEVLKGIVYYVARAWVELDIKELLWQTVVNMFWPPATIKAIFDQFSQLWNDHWATTVDSLYGPRNFFDDPLGCLHDIWSNFLILLDFPLSLWRTLNNVVGLLMGYITIIVVIAEAIAGGIAAAEAGVVPGLLAGALAGLATVAPLGLFLMKSYILAEGVSVGVILLRLFTARQLCEKREVDILTSVASFITMAVAIALQILMALLARLVSLIAELLKGVPKPAPSPAPQPPTPRPPAPRPPAPRPRPRPQPQPALQLKADAGGENIIPLLYGVAPGTPAVQKQNAVEFEDGVNAFPSSQTLQNEESNSILTNEFNGPNQEIATMPLIEEKAAANGTVQTKATSRESRINPDACEKKKGICYERSLTYGINRTSMYFTGIGPTPDDLRVAACLLRTATGSTFSAFGKNVAIGKFLVNGSYDYIPGVNIPRGNIHSEDIILIEANRRYGPGNYKLAALFSERVPCDRCESNLKGTPLTPDARIYAIIDNDYDRRSIMRAYNNGVLF